MRALRVVAEEGPDGVVLTDVAEPDAELVVQVHSAGVSFPDLLMTRGEYQVRQKPPFTLGWEAAGEVVRAPAAGPFAVGDRVMTLSFGAYAEQVAAIPETTFAMPTELSYQEGAALPLNYLTALAALDRRGGLRPGERVLVHGAAGGVGSAAIQVAKGLGANVIACVSTVEKGEVALALGADSTVIGEDFREQLDEPVDLIVDPVGGGQRFKESLRCLAPEGRIVVVGFASGQIPHVSLNRLLLRNIDVRGCNFGVFAADSGSREAVTRRLHDLVAAGTISPLIGSVYPLEEVPAALNELAERRAVGKLIATVGG